MIWPIRQIIKLTVFCTVSPALPEFPRPSLVITLL
nr:MAG TPA: hypothetical protein [Caudoviricetes sp.]